MKEESWSGLAAKAADGRSLNMRPFEVQEVVEQGASKSSRQRPDPENTVVGPMGGGEGGAKGARGIESAACKWSVDKYAEGVHKTGRKAGNGTESSAIVKGSSKQREHQEKSCGGFEGHARPAWKIARKLRSAEGHGAPGILRNDGS